MKTSLQRKTSLQEAGFYSLMRVGFLLDLRAKESSLCRSSKQRLFMRSIGKKKRPPMPEGALPFLYGYIEKSSLLSLSVFSFTGRGGTRLRGSY